MTRNDIGNIHARKEVRRAEDDKTFDLHVTILAFVTLSIFFSNILANIIAYYHHCKSKHLHKTPYRKKKDAYVIRILFNHMCRICRIYIGKWIFVWRLSSIHDIIDEIREIINNSPNIKPYNEFYILPYTNIRQEQY